MGTTLDPVIITPTRLHYILNFEGRECASVEVSSSTAHGPYVAVQVSTYDDDVRAEFVVKPG